MSAMKDQIATIMAIVKIVYVIVMIHILETLVSSSYHVHFLPLEKLIHLVSVRCHCLIFVYQAQHFQCILI